MSPIASTSPFATDTNPPSVAKQAATAAVSPTSTDALTSENTFLKLLVAQIKNQDPTSPTDPTQFVAQLTQYSELEQLIQINGNVKTLDSNSPVAASPAGSTSNNANTVSTAQASPQNPTT